LASPAAASERRRGHHRRRGGSNRQPHQTAVARSPNVPPRSKVARRRVIGKPTSCCSPGAAKGCWFSTNDKPASAWFKRPVDRKAVLTARTIARQLGKLHRRCARQSASTTETSSPNITDFTKLWRQTFFCDPHSPVAKRRSGKHDRPPATRIARKTDLETISPGRPQTPRSAPQQHPTQCLDFKTPAEAFSKLNQSLHFKRDSIPRLRGVWTVFRHDKITPAASAASAACRAESPPPPSAFPPARCSSRTRIAPCWQAIVR